MPILSQEVVNQDVAGSAPTLSGFEARCLGKRLCDCEMNVHQALLGATEVRAKLGEAAQAVRICECLRAAEQQLETARLLAEGLQQPSRSQPGGAS